MENFLRRNSLLSGRMPGYDQFTMAQHPTNTTVDDIESEEGEMNLVALWLTFDLPRTIAGIMAGVFAGIVAWVFGGLIAMQAGMEFWVPFKLAATPMMGAEAMNYGFSAAVIVGLIVHCAICAVLGGVYGHFTKTNKILPLLGAGFMWGTFSWIFIQNLFVRSFLDVRTYAIPSGVAFFVLLVFGLSLVSIKFFDRIVCGKAR